MQTARFYDNQPLHLPSMVRPPYQEGPGHTFAIHPSWIHASWSSSWRYSQLGSLQTSCPHSTKLNCDLDPPFDNTSPTCDLCNAHDVQDEQHVLFRCIHPHVVSLWRTYSSLLSSAGLNNVSAFLGQEDNKLYFFLHALMVFYEQSHFLTEGLFLVTLVSPTHRVRVWLGKAYTI